MWVPGLFRFYVQGAEKRSHLWTWVGSLEAIREFWLDSQSHESMRKWSHFLRVGCFNDSGTNGHPASLVQLFTRLLMTPVQIISYRYESSRVPGSCRPVLVYITPVQNLVSVRVHPGSVLWLCIRLHDTGSKSRTGTRHTSASSPWLMYRIEINLGTKTRTGVK